MSTELHITQMPSSAQTDCTVDEVANRALNAVTPGRYFGFFWPIGLGNDGDPAWEHRLVTHLLGVPHSRLQPSGEDSGVEFFATQFIRAYSDDVLDRPAAEIACVIFRDASGPPAYKTRLARSAVELAEARLPTKHPAFTRDFANNVWHISAKNHIEGMVQRLAQLLTWPGETFMLSTWDGSTLINDVNRVLGNHVELIPRARKAPYNWRSNGTEQTLFE